LYRLAGIQQNYTAIQLLCTALQQINTEIQQINTEIQLFDTAIQQTYTAFPGGGVSRKERKPRYCRGFPFPWGVPLCSFTPLLTLPLFHDILQAIIELWGLGCNFTFKGAFSFKLDILICFFELIEL
jgi:hypothetical protein